MCFFENSQDYFAASLDNPKYIDDKDFKGFMGFWWSFFLITMSLTNYFYLILLDIFMDCVQYELF